MVRIMRIYYINELVPIPDMYSMYPKYHEMDITQFVDRVNEIDKEKRCYESLRS